MKENNELERKDIVVGRDMEADDDNARQIKAYMETWFDVDKKFHIDTASDDSAWLNMYGKYNPYKDSLIIKCEISSDDGSSLFDYIPTNAEARLVKDMITEKIKEIYNQTPQEFCESNNGEQIMGEIQ